MNKYHAKKTVYEGVVYASKREATYAQELDLRVRAKDIRSWRRQLPIRLEANGVKLCTHILDFEITHLNGSTELVEVKGFETAIWRLKKKLLEALYLKDRPEITYTIVR